MADNVTLPGTSEVVAADDCGAGGKVQIIKLAISTDGSATPIPADAANGLTVGGNVAHDAVDAGSPVKVGGYASTTAPAAVLAGDRVNAWMSLNGATYVVPAANFPVTDGVGAAVANAANQCAVAHDTADSGSSVKAGARAAPLAASVTLVTVGDRTDNVSDLDGGLIVRPGCQLGDLISDVLDNTDGAATAFAGSFAATASLRHYITALSMMNTSATTITVLLRDGTGGATIWKAIVPAGGGYNIAFNPPLRQPSVNTALAIDGSAAATTLTVAVAGFKSKA